MTEQERSERSERVQRFLALQCRCPLPGNDEPPNPQDSLSLAQRIRHRYINLTTPDGLDPEDK